jgi:hypothetical protein
MTRHNILKTVQAVFIGGCTMLCASSSRAETLSFHVAVDTSSLVSSLNGPFSLDFQLNGLGPLTNAVTLGNFNFTGGAPSGSPSLNGNAAGDLSSTVSLNDVGSAFNEFFEGFAAGTTEIQFDESITENVNAGTPDEFAMAILDGNVLNIPTTSPDGADSLMELTVTQSNLAISNIQTFTSTDPDAGVTVTVTATPEPGTLGMFLSAGLLAAGWISLRRSRRSRAAVR